MLVVGGETLSRITNWDDRSTCVLFGDAAGAVVLEATERECGVLSTVLGSRGDSDHMLAIEAGGSARPASAETVARREHFLTMRGCDIFRHAVRAMSRAGREALMRAGVNARDVHAVIAHQANLRILQSTQEILGLPWEKFVVNVERYGNTGAASVPLALSEYLTAGRARPGDNLLLSTFGGGLTWAAAVVRWVMSRPSWRSARRNPWRRSRVAPQLPFRARLTGPRPQNGNSGNETAQVFSHNGERDPVIGVAAILVGDAAVDGVGAS